MNTLTRFNRAHIHSHRRTHGSRTTQIGKETYRPTYELITRPHAYNFFIHKIFNSYLSIYKNGIRIIS